MGHQPQLMSIHFPLWMVPVLIAVAIGFKIYQRKRDKNR